jgi:hypothetical protein
MVNEWYLNLDCGAKDTNMIIEAKPTWKKHLQARFAEWFNAFVMMMWGAYVILHPGMFVDPRVSAIWGGLLQVASQQTWGLIAFVNGSIRLGALYVNGRRKVTPSIRLAASFVSAFIWTQIVLGIWNGGVSNPGLMIYPALILGDIYSAFRAGSDATFVARQDVSESRSNGTLAS